MEYSRLEQALNESNVKLINGLALYPAFCDSLLKSYSGLFTGSMDNEGAEPPKKPTLLLAVIFI